VLEGDIKGYYRIKWLDPYSGSEAADIGINADAKRVERIRFGVGDYNLNRPMPKIDVPTPLARFYPHVNPEYARKLLPIAAFDVGECFGRCVGPAFAGVNQDTPAQVGGPNPVFNILVTVDDEPSPRLPDGNGLQFFESRRSARGFPRLSLHTGKTFITSSPR
jgi:hypothetical protein